MSQLPLFLLNVVLFPGMALPIHVFEERYKTMIGRCLEERSPFGVVLIKSGTETGEPAVPFEVGTSAAIAQVQQLPQGRLNLLAVGQERFRIVHIVQERPYLIAEVEPLASVIGDDPHLMESAQRVSALFAEYHRLYLTLAGQWSRTLQMPANPTALVDYVAARLSTDNRVKQELLETLSVARRLHREEEILGQEMAALAARLRQAQQERYAGFAVLN